MNTWIALLTFVGGYFAKSITDWITHRQTLAREREARLEDRREARAFRRNQFQRETLVELQDVASALIRSTAAGHHQDTMAFRQTGEWGRQPLDEEASDAHAERTRRVVVLTARVTSEEIADAATAFRNACADVLAARAEQQGDAAMEAAGVQYLELNSKIGEALKQLDRADDELLSNGAA